MSESSPMPGADRVVTRDVAGHQMSLRRPSRADEAEIWRRLVGKLTVRGIPGENDLLNSWDGYNLQWEARFEVLLIPRMGRRGDTIRLGEQAPVHWLESLEDGNGKTLGQIVSFESVTPEEFAEAQEAFKDVFEKKSQSTPGIST